MQEPTIKQYFVTGTDTNVGKTLISAMITSVLQSIYWKPIQSGTEDNDSDLSQVKHWTGLSDEYFWSSVYELSKSLSPHEASRYENIDIHLEPICKKVLPERCIIEGAGGLMVPLNDESIMLDLIQALAIPVIIVARGTLGTINHTLLTISALTQKKIPIKGVVFSGELNPSNQAAIEKWGGVKTLFHIPHLDKLDHATFNAELNRSRASILQSL